MFGRIIALSLVGGAVAVAGAQTLAVSPLASGLSQPIAVIQDPLDPAIQFAVQQGGLIRVIQNGVVLPTPFLTESVVTGGENGLLGLAFPPDHATSGHFYIHFRRTGGFMQIRRYTRSGPTTVQSGSGLDIFRTSRPFDNHNAGTIHFSPVDGYLYFPTGDGGSGGDPGNVSQNPTSLLGKFVRIDPRTDDFPADPNRNYAIPPDNPFLDGVPIAASPEIWSFGTRNPWKFSFDNPAWLGTGGLWMADVGQSTREEVSYEPPLSGGRNYGWRRFEGTFVYSNSTPLAYTPHTPPVYEYGHSEGRSITGGYVYRGLQMGPAFFGRYFFADYVEGFLRSGRVTINPSTGEATLTDVQDHSNDFGGAGSLGLLASIDVDANGELLIVNRGGTVSRLVRRNAAWVRGISTGLSAITSGQIRNLIEEDQRPVVLQPVLLTSSAPRRTQLFLDVETNVANATTLDLEFVVRQNQLTSAGVVELQNRASGAWVEVGTFTPTVQWQRFRLTNLSLADYLQNGRVNVRLATTRSGPLLTSRFLVEYDQVFAVAR